jgi:hypothetical protein
MGDFLQRSTCYSESLRIHGDETKLHSERNVYGFYLFVMHHVKEAVHKIPSCFAIVTHSWFTYMDANAADVSVSCWWCRTSVCCASQTNDFLGNVSNPNTIFLLIFPQQVPSACFSTAQKNNITWKPFYEFVNCSCFWKTHIRKISSECKTLLVGTVHLNICVYIYVYIILIYFVQKIARL